MSWVDVSAGSVYSGSEAGYSLLRGFINSLGNALNNAGAEGITGFPWQVGNENEQIVGFYDDPQGYYRVIKKFLAKVNYHSNSRLIDLFKPPKQKSQISLVFGMNALVSLGTIKTL
ncbi:hypothetical protein ACPDJP_04285 [Helicobacter pylori]|uniref:hypothetical protein n=1 Tax=Helicobacter pylori TaxID=210 RepID=UPI003DA9D8B1